MLALMIMEELRRIIKKVMEDQVEREDMIRSIARLLEKHKGFEGTVYGAVINTFIQAECQKKYAVCLRDDEVKHFWG
jgi:hypothetical protein